MKRAALLRRTEPTPLRVEDKPCCADCTNPVHAVKRKARELMTEAQYQRLLRVLREGGIE